MDHLDAAVRASGKANEWTAKRDAEVEAAYTEDGYTLGQIADRLGLTLEAVRQRLIQRGVEIRPRGRSREKTK